MTVLLLQLVVVAEMSAPAVQDIAKLTVPVLKEYLKVCKLPVGGNKADLVERLVEFIQA